MVKLRVYKLTKQEGYLLKIIITVYLIVRHQEQALQDLEIKIIKTKAVYFKITHQIRQEHFLEQMLGFFKIKQLDFSTINSLNKHQTV